MLTVIRVTPDAYASVFPTTSHVYNSVKFSELNRNKAEEVIYLLLNDEKGKPQFGITLGLRENMLLSPFSAPFGGVETVKQRKSVAHWIEAAECVKEYAAVRNFALRIALPPSFYSPTDALDAQSLAFSSTGLTNVPEYNYHFPHNFPDLSSSSRNKLTTAKKQNFDIKITDEVDRAYAVIRENREERGYPLRMTLEQVKETVKVIKADFWLVSLGDEDVAAAQIYHVAPGVVQVIYWGDKRRFSAMRPMNLLAWEVARHYAEKGILVDVGPSSSDGVPSYGLCDFKENIGCVLSPKNVFTFLPAAPDNLSR
ncbi:MAG: GNAT family N-acetyltransferase [Duncaniella sp.]|nr:GNAT family N-acetyltransferase [Duncaniella sp.]